MTLIQVAQPAPLPPKAKAIIERAFGIPHPMRLICPTRQTTRQPIVWRCLNPACWEGGESFYEFTRDYPECPKCTAKPPIVQKKVLIHLLVRDPKGLIIGFAGMTWRMLCDPRRPYLGTRDNGESGTPLVEAANCPGCLREFQKQLKG